MKKFLIIYLLFVLNFCLTSAYAQTENINALWEKSQIETANKNYASAYNLLTKIINSTSQDDTVNLKAKITLAQVLGNIDEPDSMNIIISSISSYLQNHPENTSISAEFDSLVYFSNAIARKNIDFADDICGIWVSDYSEDANYIPFIALKISKRGRDYITQILPYCTLAASNKMYTKKTYKHISQRQCTFGNKPEIRKNTARLFFGEETLRKGNVFAAAFGAAVTMGLGEAAIDHILENSDNSSVLKDIAAVAVVTVATNVVASLFSRLAISKKTETTYDILIERLFAGCADLYVQQNIYIKKSNGYEKEKTTAIKFMLYKLYPEYDVVFMTNQHEMLGYKEFSKNETKNSNQYKIAKVNIRNFNQQSYEKLNRKIAYFYKSVLHKKDDDLLQNINENFKYSTKGLLYAEQELRNGIYKGRVNTSGVRNGLGHYKWNNGNQYTGEWRNGNMYGTGQLIFADGTEYNGIIIDNKKFGYGNLKSSNFEYHGKFYNDRYEGDGELIKDNITTKGIFKNGNIESGKEIYENGDVFEGHWNWEKQTRNGKMNYANGDIYTGNWILKNNNWIKEGNGVMTANGETKSEKWKNEKLER
ncbi:MAG: hypothetical protein LBT27_07120 [Prevotellaceae bacterium]|jgi:hypothetical protein|nr:hypothetical protein [Prevotellaceae bacterium]